MAKYTMKPAAVPPGSYRARFEAIEDTRRVDYGPGLRTGDTPAPAVPRLVASDAPPEGLGTLRHEYGGRTAILSAEGGVLPPRVRGVPPLSTPAARLHIRDPTRRY